MEYKKIENLSVFKGTHTPTHFTIELRPTTKCNYNCFYCTDLHINENKVIRLNENNLVKVINSIRKYTQKDVHIFICGGEPTVYPYLTELLNIASEHLVNNDYIEIQSNLGMSYSKLVKFIDKIENKEKVNISVSYHNTQCDNYIAFIKKCLYLKSKKMLKMISYGYNSKKSVVNDFNLGVKIIGKEHCEIVPLINASVDQDHTKGNETYKEIDILNDLETVGLWKDHSHFFDNQLVYVLKDGTQHTTNRNEMWKNRHNNFLGTKCSIPKWKIYIDWDGGVYKCFNEQFSPLKPVFNINDDYNFDDYFKHLKCMDCCFTTCFFDMEYEKNEQDKNVNEVKIDRFFNTATYKKIKK
jgi:organic radical activating enzyme